MKMRVSIARALVTRPQILLMDEPFAALDEITRIKLNDDLLQLFSRQGLTVIFVTHSVYESVYLSSRIVVMSSRPGRISADIPIDVSYPRDEEYRTSTLYNERCRFVSAALRHAMTLGRDANRHAMLRHLVPKSIRAPFARYSHAVEVPAGARWLLCSGQLGISTDDKIPESTGEQAVLCFEAIGACLREARMSFGDIVRINAYVTAREHMAPYMAVRDRYVGAAGAGFHPDDRRRLHPPGVHGRDRGHRGEGRRLKSFHH